MTRVVGLKNRSPFVLDPLEALRAGRSVDAMLANSGPPRERGVFRATHRKMNERDAARQREAALRISSGKHG